MASEFFNRISPWYDRYYKIDEMIDLVIVDTNQLNHGYFSTLGEFLVQVPALVFHLSHSDPIMDSLAFCFI